MKLFSLEFNNFPLEDLVSIEVENVDFVEKSFVKRRNNWKISSTGKLMKNSVSWMIKIFSF